MAIDTLQRVLIRKNLDADEIVPGLWQGSIPPGGSILAQLGIDVVVFCAIEVQPPTTTYPGVEVIYAPNDDNPWRKPSRPELETALRAARRCTQALQEGESVLVTCRKGRNRSGLVTALTLYLWRGLDGDTAIKLIREKRRGPPPLVNAGFNWVLRNLRPRTVPSTTRAAPAARSTV